MGGNRAVSPFDELVARHDFLGTVDRTSSMEMGINWTTMSAPVFLTASLSTP